MSPVSAASKCPYGTGEDTHAAEVVTAVGYNEDGGGERRSP